MNMNNFSYNLNYYFVSGLCEAVKILSCLIFMNHEIKISESGINVIKYAILAECKPRCISNTSLEIVHLLRNAKNLLFRSHPTLSRIFHEEKFPLFELTQNLRLSFPPKSVTK